MSLNKAWLVIVGVVMWGSLNVCANTLKYVPGIKVGKGVVALVNDVEYERNIFPFITSYIRFGGAGYNVPGASNVSAKFSNIGAGIRANALLLTIGAGFESSQVELTDGLSGGRASGAISGLVVDVGKSFGIGPISLGASIGLQFAVNRMQYDDGDSFGLGDLALDGSSTLLKVDFSAGYHF